MLMASGVASAIAAAWKQSSRDVLERMAATGEAFSIEELGQKIIDATADDLAEALTPPSYSGEC